VKDQGYEIEDQWFIEDFWRQYKVKKIPFKFIGISLRKNNRKRDENARNRTWDAATCSLAPGTPLRLRQHLLLPQAPIRLLLFSLWYVFLLFWYDVCFHKQLNLLSSVLSWTPSYLLDSVNKVYIQLCFSCVWFNLFLLVLNAFSIEKLRNF